MYPGYACCPSFLRTATGIRMSQQNGAISINLMKHRAAHLFLDVGIGGFDHFLNFSRQISTHLSGADRSHGAKC